MRALSSVWGQTPLSVEGVSDRQTATDTVTLRVPSSAGYTYSVLLDTNPIPTDIYITVRQTDYHELRVQRTELATGTVTNRVVRFIIQSSNRGNPEKGLIEWLPYPSISSTAEEFAGASLRLMMPQAYPMGLEIPVIAWVEDALGNERRGNGIVTAPGFEPYAFKVRRGVGSGFLPPVTNGTGFEYGARLGGLLVSREIAIATTTTWTQVSGVLSGAVNWPDNSRIQVTGSLTIPAGSALTIGAGTVVRLNYLVNITNTGRTVINGTVDQPVVFTSAGHVSPERPGGVAWGGFLLRGASAELIANGAILVGGGGATSFDFSPSDSHRAEQAVLLVHSGARAFLTNCAIINTAGQVANAYNSEVTYDHCLLQKAITAGEYVGGTILVNHSAVIEFPEENGVVNATIADADYDGIYLTTGTHIFRNSLFGFCKDDAIDSGSGGAGTMWVSNCWVESALHEAHAWSGSGRVAASYDVVLMNSGQGLECGWSSSAGSPDVFADRMLSIGNSVGARFGDNYDWDYWGFLRATNSLFLNNYRDIWGMNWDNWLYGIYTPAGAFRMDLQGNFVTQPNTNHPNNTLWDPARDGGRLAHWMTTPPDAPVGMGFAVWTNQFPMSNIFSGVPVRLSSFTTNFVSVDYSFESDATILSTGTLIFAPGETVKRIFPAGFGLQDYTTVRAVLRNPAGGQLTGETNVTFQGSVATPQFSLGIATNQLPGTRLMEGIFVMLSSPSAAAVSLNYQFESSSNAVAGGTFVLNPLETSKQLFATGFDAFSYDFLRLTVSNPTGATLTGITNVTFTNTPLTMRLAVASAQLPLDQFSAGVPVALSGPAPAGVSVDFTIDSDRGVLTNGTLLFGPGEIFRTIPTVGMDGAPANIVRASLSNPVRAPFGGLTTVYFVRTVTAPPATNATFIAKGSRWRWRDAASDPGPTWKDPGFDDSTWPEGRAQLGFGEGDETTAIASNRQVTSYFRCSFNVSDPATYTNLSLWLLRDDGGVVHLNGTEIFRSPNLPAPPTNILYSTLTLLGLNGENTIDTAVTNCNALVPETNVLAVEIHQQNTTSSDVSFDFELIGLAGPPIPPPQSVYFGAFDGQLTVAWGDATFGLEQTDAFLGTNTVWTPVPGPSPVGITPNPAIPQRFFRLKGP